MRRACGLRRVAPTGTDLRGARGDGRPRATGTARRGGGPALVRIQHNILGYHGRFAGATGLAGRRGYVVRWQAPAAPDAGADKKEGTMANLGIMIEGQEGLTWERWRRLARLAEDLGYESLWRSDHLFSLFGRAERESLETFVSLVLVAQETRRIRFGPLVTSITFRHPAMLARMAAAVDVLSGGRLELGMGAGWHQREHEAFGIPFPPVRTRMEMLEEGIQVVRALTSGQRCSFQGRHYQLRDVESRPTPVQRPLPIIVGGSGERRLLGIVARHADEWNVVSMTPETYRQKRAALERHCEAAGRDPAAIRRSWMGGFLVGESAAALERRARRLQEVVPVMGQVKAADLPGVLRARGWLVGRPDDVVEQARALAAEGIQRFMLQLHDQEDEEAVELVAREVLPKLSA